MIHSSPSLLSEQLRAARALFEEAVHTRALVLHEALDARLLTMASSVTQDALLAWACDFLTALPLKGHLKLEDSLLAWAPDFLTALPLKGHLELVARVWSLKQELEGQRAGAVFALGLALVQQQRLELGEVTGIAAELGAEPTAEALRTVLQTWCSRGAAWGGPILGWMRDLRDRLEVSPMSNEWLVVIGLVVGVAVVFGLYLRSEQKATRSLIAGQDARIVELTEELASLRSTLIAAGAAERAPRLLPAQPSAVKPQPSGAAKPATPAPPLPAIERRVVEVTRGDEPIYTRTTVAEHPAPGDDPGEPPPSTRPSGERRMLLAALDHETARLDGIDDGVPPARSAQYQELLHDVLVRLEQGIAVPADVESRVVALVLARRAKRADEQHAHYGGQLDEEMGARPQGEAGLAGVEEDAPAEETKAQIRQRLEADEEARETARARGELGQVPTLDEDRLSDVLTQVFSKEEAAAELAGMKAGAPTTSVPKPGVPKAAVDDSADRDWDGADGATMVRTLDPDAADARLPSVALVPMPPAVPATQRPPPLPPLTSRQVPAGHRALEARATIVGGLAPNSSSPPRPRPAPLVPSPSSSPPRPVPSLLAALSEARVDDHGGRTTIEAPAPSLEATMVSAGVAPAATSFAWRETTGAAEVARQFSERIDELEKGREDVAHCGGSDGSDCTKEDAGARVCRCRCKGCHRRRRVRAQTMLEVLGPSPAQRKAAVVRFPAVVAAVRKARKDVRHCQSRECGQAPDPTRPHDTEAVVQEEVCHCRCAGCVEMRRLLARTYGQIADEAVK